MSDTEPTAEPAADQNADVKPKAEGAAGAVTINVKDNQGEITTFKLKQNTVFSKLFKAYAQKKGINADTVRFFRDGQRIGPNDTPSSLDLEEGDEIESMLEQTGGGRLDSSACSMMILATVAQAFHQPASYLLTGPRCAAATGYAQPGEHGRCTVDPLPELQNRYFALRHGQSIANMEGIISSDPVEGTIKHGLSTSGRAQARQSATKLIEIVGRDHIDDLIFISSNFTRARETAADCRMAVTRISNFEREAVGKSFSCPAVQIRNELRERYFGKLDGTTLPNYNKVWPRDLQDAHQEEYGVESIGKVCVRLRELFMSLEQKHIGKSLVFISHADTLQIMQCYVAEADVRLFSQYRFKNGEVRALMQDQDSLPEPRPLSFQ